MDAALWFTRIHLQLQSVSFIPSLHISFACPWYLEEFIDFSIWRNGLNEKLATDWTSATNLSELSRNHSCSLSFLQKLSAAIDWNRTARNPYILLDCPHSITFDIDDEFVWCKSMSSSEIDEPKDPHLCSFCRIPQNPPDGGIPQKYLEKIQSPKSQNSEKSIWAFSDCLTLLVVLIYTLWADVFALKSTFQPNFQFTSVALLTE